MNEPKVGVKYNHSEIEKKWIGVWDREQTYVTPGRTGKPKSYVLGMFPYPSGEGLHTGHGRIFTAVDVIARYQRMKGYDVLCPMGWDAFGLPAENAAIKARKNPVDMVPHNEANFKRQMMMLGLSYDWDRAFSTTDPAYYKWTQWLFLKLYSIKNDKGERLVYRKEVPINWCPFCLTGLANEEVQADGTHERCGTVVTEKLLPQWNMRITDYADRLLKDLDIIWEDPGTRAEHGAGQMQAGLDWPEGILAQQRNWIGKKSGVKLRFKVKEEGGKELEVFTTRPDTLEGVTFLVVAPEHPVVDQVKDEKVMEYVKEVKEMGDPERAEKTGIFSGLNAVNPFTGKEIPIWIADYVLVSFGTGAIMAVPSHDERDKEFAIKYGLTINSEYQPDEKMADWIVAEGIGERITNYHLRDWVFSRQRYWGEPFPLVYCPKCGDENGVVPLPTDQLPLTLPYLQSYEPTETGQSPLSRIKEWVETTCPNCGGKARRETDTMPNWAGSCWYFLRFADPANDKEPWSEKALNDWLPVDWYLGGAEHAVLHLLYARFWTKAFYDLGLVKFTEPFLRLRSVGMVLAADGKKMSKSLGNVINPDEVVAEFGADAVRIYEMFMGPWDQAIAWNSRSLIGCRRFIEKIWELASRDMANNWRESDGKLAAELNKLIKKVGDDIAALKFNTAVAALMKFTNTWVDVKTGLSKEDMKRLLRVLAPLAPFMTEELWQVLGGSGSIHLSGWPEVGKIMAEEMTVIVQVNGKKRGSLVLPMADSQDEKVVIEKALADEKVKKWVGGEYKVVFVPGRLINFVVV